MSHGSANAVLDRLESMGLSNPSNVVNLCRILEHSKDRSCWEYSIEALLSDTLEPAVKADATRDTILLVNPIKSSPASGEFNIFEFQDHVREHIRAYADRVEKHQLGVSGLICKEVEETMSEVWRALPIGFGALLPHDLPSRMSLD
ncbi:hypothetical protein FRC08_005510 [Ceratobasidium sp. 394]|nr:hypothetical protein FRC08_005510 [Ceratobasidium sp. 394]